MSPIYVCHTSPPKQTGSPHRKLPPAGIGHKLQLLLHGADQDQRWKGMDFLDMWRPPEEKKNEDTGATGAHTTDQKW